MNAMPIVGAILSLGEAYTHSTLLHYLSAGWQIIAWTVFGIGWWRISTQRAPLPIVYGCPHRCGFQGDEASVESHMDYCYAANRTA